MRRFLFSTAIAALLVACSPPAQQQAEAPTPDSPALPVCNDVAPDAARQVAIEDGTAVATAANDLPGGPIAPGLYDLTRATRINQATGWDGTRAVALEVSENPSGGVVFEWAGVTPDGSSDTWNANFTDTPNARLAYTCGRIGEIDAGFTASGANLQLRLPDGANGALNLDFTRRS